MPRAIDSYLHLPRRRYFSALELHAVAIGTIAAIVFFIGYGFNITAVQSVIPGFPTMRPVAAAAFMLLSISCTLSLRPSRNARLLSALIAVGTAIWILTRVFNNWGAEQDGESILVPIQGTLLSVLLSCVVIILINFAPQWRIAVGVIALLVATPALFRILSLFLFWGAPNEEGSLLSSMGIHTAILIVWFMGVCVLMHPRLGFGAVVQQTSLRGRLLRGALPAVVILPVVTAVLCLLLSLTFHWAEELLFAISATVGVTLGAALIWWLSRLAADWQAEANEQASRLSRANEALEQYASSAAHDLKAPARHVLLYGELMEEALAKGDVASARRHARSIRESAREMPKIIDGMLDFSRSAFTRITLSDNSLSELVQAAAAICANDLEAAGAEVTVLHEVMLRCDSTLMTTVLQNLITNAIKNRRKDRALAIRIDGVREEGGWRVSVEDNGVGFDPDFATVAFNPLARGVHTAGEGTGIGLSTCRTIVQSHGGEIRIDAGYRHGARIEFTIPEHAPAAS